MHGQWQDHELHYVYIDDTHTHTCVYNKYYITWLRALAETVAWRNVAIFCPNELYLGASSGFKCSTQQSTTSHTKYDYRYASNLFPSAAHSVRSCTNTAGVLPFYAECARAKYRMISVFNGCLFRLQTPHRSSGTCKH